MSLLTIIQEACSEINLSRPSTVVGNTDEQVIALLNHCNREGRELMRCADWTVLIRLHTINTVDGQDEYALPSDYDRLIKNTEWDRSERRPMHGPSSPQEWQEIKSSLINNSIVNKRYRIYRSLTSTSRSVWIDPTPGATSAELTFEYVSENWCSDSGGTTPANAWAADTDVTFFNEDLMQLGTVVRYKRARGFDFASEADEYQQMLETLKSHDRPAKVLYLHHQHGLPLISNQNVPDTGYGV